MTRGLGQIDQSLSDNACTRPLSGLDLLPLTFLLPLGLLHERPLADVHLKSTKYGLITLFQHLDILKINQACTSQKLSKIIQNLTETEELFSTPEFNKLSKKALTKYDIFSNPELPTEKISILI